MIVYATVSERTVRTVEISIPDGEYTEKDIREMAEDGELLCCGDVVDEQVELANEITSIEIDGIEE